MLRVSVSANSLARARIASAILNSSVPRSRAIDLLHAPPSKAARAAAIALLTSSALASGTLASTWPVAGLMMSRVCLAATHFPPIHILCSPMRDSLALLAMDGHAALRQLGEKGCGGHGSLRWQRAACGDLAAGEHLHCDRRGTASVDVHAES